jgi:hypothetical protein
MVTLPDINHAQRCQTLVVHRPLENGVTDDVFNVLSPYASGRQPF